MNTIDVNSDAVVVFTNKLEKLSLTSLPNVIRKTLNQAAMDVKQRTLQESAADNLVSRQKTFFKSKSKVNFASGNDIRLMQAEVGMINSGLLGSNSHAVDNLEQQEHGGIISGRKLVSTDTVRVSKSRSKLVRKGSRISDLKNVKTVNGEKSEWKSAAIKVGVGGLIRGTFKPLIFRVKSIGDRGNGQKVQLIPVAMIRESSSFRVKRTKFAEEAAVKSQMKMPDIFVKEAEKRLEQDLR